jgi:[ribosomal protein S5]-alanine N-acetyltransferase
MQYPIRLETARLFTRPLTMEDQHGWKRFFEHPFAAQYLPLKQEEPLEVARQWMERHLGRYRDGKYGFMAWMHRESGAWIGQCGLLAQQVDGMDELEVGYHVFPDHWRQGYAIEAAQAVRDWGFQQGLAPSLISIIHRENLASQAVALRNGMTREKSTHVMGIDVYIYRIWREEWEQLGAVL